MCCYNVKLINITNIRNCSYVKSHSMSPSKRVVINEERADMCLIIDTRIGVIVETVLEPVAYVLVEIATEFKNTCI